MGLLARIKAAWYAFLNQPLTEMEDKYATALAETKLQQATERLFAPATDQAEKTPAAATDRLADGRKVSPGALAPAASGSQGSSNR